MAVQPEALPTTPLLSSTTRSAPTNSRLGIVLILCACFLFSGMHVSVRYASERLGLDPMFLACARGVIQATLVTALLTFYILTGYITTVAENTASFMLIRGFLGSLAMLSKYESLSRLPVGIAVSLFSTTPLFAALLGFILVREVLSNSDLVSMALCLCGALLVGISDGSMKLDGHILGMILTMSGAAITGLVFVTIRAIGTQVHFLFSVQAMGLGAMFTPFLIRVIQEGDVGEAWTFMFDNFEKARATREGVLAVLCLGCFSCAAAMCLNRALQCLGAGKAAIMRTFDIPINFVTGFLIMGELPHATGQLFGCILITMGIYVNVAVFWNTCVDYDFVIVLVPRKWM